MPNGDAYRQILARSQLRVTKRTPALPGLSHQPAEETRTLDLLHGNCWPGR
jgi:hypothetical protein